MKNTRPKKPPVFFLAFILVVAFVTGSQVYAVIFQQQSQTVTQTIRNTNWLYGWNKRVKITINHSDIDSDLSNFPVLVYLSNSSGQDNDDVTFVFDELQSDANRKKIAITTSNGTTQGYVEIEKWDQANEQAWLWVKVSSINSTADTDLYLYYDKDHADNTDYVGDSQSTPAQNVWSPKYSAVFHYNSNFLDSVDGDTPSNTPGATFAAGKIANAGEFYDNGDEADYSTMDALGGSGATDDDVGTLAFWMKGSEASYDYMVDVGYTSGFIPANYQTASNQYLQTWWGSWRTGSMGLVTLIEWHHVVVRWNASSGFTMWVDGLSYNSYSGAKSIVVSQVTIGNYINHGAFEANALIDEVRFVDDEEASDAWIKASYESGREDLLDFGSEEIGASWGDYSSELLTNPGAEGGNTNGWTATGPNAANFAAGYDCPSGSAGPHTGSYAFYWNNPSSSSDWSYQEIDLSPWLSEVQAGDAQIKAKGWLVCSEYHVPPWDIVRMRVVFYDSSSQEISADTYDTGERGDVQTWTEFGMENYPIPSTAVKARIYFQTYETSWDAGNADDFTVKIRTYG